MSSVKPKLDLESTRAFLETYFGTQVTGLQMISQGETSQAYFFRHQNDEYVIRFSYYEDSFLRDRYAFETLSHYGIPIPRIIEINQFNNMFFAISERVPGNTLITYKPNQIEVLIPSLLDMMLRIRSANVDSTQGYGPIGHSGEGLYQSWAEHLEASFNENQTGFWRGWTGLFDDTFLEKDVFDVIRARMMKYAKYCKSIREFVHGDLSIDNVLSDGQSLTGIIDWGNARYGDSLYDVSWFHLWTPMFNLPARFRQYCEAQGIPLPHFEERIVCHTYYQGLDALRFFAKTGRVDAYTRIREHLLSL